jgi:DNA-binding winged helix-turn-helix (wHTH) protein
MNMQITWIAEREPKGSSGAPQAFPGRYARFGAFQADLERGELHQNGERVKVQAKLFQALLVLLCHAGEIVTREEVRRQLWPDASLSNIDANVNTTMNKLRQVLGDSPDNPAYIETIPRRGYSFLASVKFSDVLDARPVDLEKSRIDTAPQGDARDTVWQKKYIPSLLRVISLVLVGMVLGALLAFIWFCAQTKNQRAANDPKVSACLTILDESPRH